MAKMNVAAFDIYLENATITQLNSADEDADDEGCGEKLLG